MSLLSGTETSVQPRELRGYQLEAVAAVQADWAAGITRVGVALPTGAGKSTVIGKLISDAYRGGGFVVALAHRGELLEQMRRDLLAVDPAIDPDDIGIVRAEEDDHHCRIVFATLQTLAHAHRRRALGQRTHIFWDEVHHAGADGYHATFKELGGYDDCYMCGFTATMHRSDKSAVGLGDVMQKISYERDLNWAIENGWLVRPTGLTVRVPELDRLDDVRIVAGDYHQGELAEVMEAAVEYTADAIELHARDRRAIVFAASVDAAHDIAEALTYRRAMVAQAVTGEMPYEHRKGIYDAFRNGSCKALVTVMVLTEGADFPMCDCVVIARPTRSRNLFSQMVGRALRLHPGKTDALVLDLSGSTRQMKLVHLSELATGVKTKTFDTEGAEVEEEPEPAGEVGVRVRRQGPVDLVRIDLFAQENDTLWLQTPKGVPFVPLRDGWIVFLWLHEDEGLYEVGAINTRTSVVRRDEVRRPLLAAIVRAQDWAVESGFELPSRNAPWHKANIAPSQGQVDLARRLKIPSCDRMTRGALSDEISIVFAARVLDRSMEE